MKVKFVPQNVEFEIEPGKSVMHLAQDHGLYVKSVCKGVPSCAECRIRVVEGDHNVMPPGSEELLLIGSGHFIDRRRLSCQLKCFGDITVDMSEQLAKQQGLMLGSKRKAALKDDRVEEAVARRGENMVDEETSNDANADAAHQHAAHPSNDPRDARESRETRDTRPRGDRRPQQQQGGGDRSPRGPRPPVQGERPQGQRPQGGGQPRPQGPRPPQAQAAGAQASGGEPRAEGTGKRRRRRRGKGGGGGGGQGGSPGRTPGGGSPSRPSGPSKPGGNA